MLTVPLMWVLCLEELYTSLLPPFRVRVHDACVWEEDARAAVCDFNGVAWLLWFGRLFGKVTKIRDGKGGTPPHVMRGGGAPWTSGGTPHSSERRS